ncbi:Uncharacterised protein [Chryseobacterium taklimakanense]|uniref:Peptidase S24/S26A/S26B/S26C domain-containing protein n=1 Tax=Chryseobacterium taklimakanense TaxID=536441 RepID=A0A239XPX4_9FLAO|nr:hypothetical protein [Chryseobacterium taklimakanense]SNV48133.1 Uncharacterised protein [Chryseobacterium taklimakanense]
MYTQETRLNRFGTNQIMFRIESEHMRSTEPGAGIISGDELNCYFYNNIQIEDGKCYLLEWMEAETKEKHFFVRAAKFEGEYIKFYCVNPEFSEGDFFCKPEELKDTFTGIAVVESYSRWMMRKEDMDELCS